MARKIRIPKRRKDGVIQRYWIVIQRLIKNPIDYESLGEYQSRKLDTKEKKEEFKKKYGFGWQLPWSEYVRGEKDEE